MKYNNASKRWGNSNNNGGGGGIHHDLLYSGVQSQKAVSAYLTSKQVLPFGFERQSRYMCLFCFV